MSEITHSIELPADMGRALAECCDRENGRYSLADILVAPESDQSAWLVATDGKCAAMVRTNAECASPVLLPGVIAKAAKVRRRGPAVRAELNGEWRIGDKVAPRSEGRFPNLDDCVGGHATAEGETVVHLDARLLAEVQEAINANSDHRFVTLYIGKHGKPIKVQGANGIGVVMPCSGDRVPNPSDYNRMRDDMGRAVKAACKSL